VVSAKPDCAMVVWEIRDTGPGIPADYLPKLFQPFSQADASMSRKHGGSGLGLAIARRLTDLMGGTLTVATQVGQGSCFRLAVPLAIIPAPFDHHETPSNTPAWSRPPSVLVVEDDATSQFTIDLMLTNLGCPHQLAKDGHEGIAAALTGHFDLVLMDCQMPVCDGYTATRMIREQAPPESRRLPIIALTANVFIQDRERCREAGMDDFLAKPCSLEALKACLVKWAVEGECGVRE
jgi:CheY-like chemotaxis protein